MTKVLWRTALGCVWLGVLGVENTTAQIALVSAPEQRLLSASASGQSILTSMSPTGRFILFASHGRDLTTNRMNDFSQLFLRDRELGKTVLISATPLGAAANGNSLGSFVDDAGSKIVFQSDASDLGPEDDNESTDVYTRDLLTGTTTLVSANTNGVAGNEASAYPAATPDGRFVAFESSASDLVANDTNRAVDVFVRDIKTGLTTRASELPVGFSPSSSPDRELAGLSTNGQFVLFTAYCARTKAPTQTAKHVFLRDTLSQTTHWISSNVPPMNRDLFADLDCAKASMTADAKYFVFTAARPSGTLSAPADAVICRHEFATGITTVIATNSVVAVADGTESLGAVMNDDGRFVAYAQSPRSPTGPSQVYRWDALTGSNVLVSVSADGLTPGNASSDSPMISTDGRVVIFGTLATNIVTQALGGEWNLVSRDLDTGITSLVSVNRDGLTGASADLGTALASDDGKVVAFVSRSPAIVPDDVNDEFDVFVWTGESGSMELISASDPRGLSSTVPGLISTFSARISRDGRFIAFGSLGSALVAGVTDDNYNAYLRDTVDGTTRLISMNNAGTGPQNGTLSSAPSPTDDGRFVAFASTANNLNDADTNRSPDVYVRDVQYRTNILVSKNVSGVSGGGLGSSDPLIAPGGEFVLFASKSPGIVAGASSEKQWIYKYDMSAGTNMNVPYPPAAPATFHSSILSTSYDRRTILLGFAFTVSPDARVIGVFDVEGARYHFVTNNAFAPAALSGDGRRLACIRKQAGTSTVELVCFDAINQTEVAALPMDSTALGNLILNGDGSRVAYAMALAQSTGANWSQVYVWDPATGSNTLVSVNMDGNPGNGSSTLVSITPDGERVLFNTRATDLVANDTTGWTDVYVRDLRTRQTRLLSENRSGSGGGNSLSVATALSLDGRSVVFHSAASDLIENDLNGATDLFLVQIPELSGDTDTDGLPDDWERLYFTDLSHTAEEDADHDGLSNGAEFEAGTNPVEPGSVLRISGIAPQLGSGIRLTWTAVSGKSYRVQQTDELVSAVWSDVAGEVTATGSVAEKDVPSSDQASRYYRVILKR